MKKILRLFRRTSGFTLVEMVVSVALLAVLLGGMMLFISPIVSSFNDNKADLIAENAATCIQEYITKSIRNANQIAIFANTNYTNLSSTDSYTTRIKAMNDFCASVNGTAVNKTYVLKCLSLKYDDGKYYLYNENVNMSSNGALDTTKSQKVFSDCLYNDMFFEFDFAKPKNGDYPAVTGAKEYRDDALELTVRAYRDTDHDALMFYGSGITELRQIKVMLASGGKESDYNLTIQPAAPLAFEDMDDDSRDIFIYYVVRQLGVSP